MDSYELVVVAGKDKGTVYPLRSFPAVIGRDQTADITLADPGVSRHHARISRDDDSLVIEDLHSTNGTYVNGEKIQRRTIEKDDLIRLGNLELLLRRAQGQQSREPEPASLAAASDTREIRLPPPPPAEQPAAEQGHLMSITQSLDSSELVDLVNRSHASLGAMYRVTRMVSSIFDLDELLDRILDEIFATIRAERAFILLLDPQTAAPQVKASRWRDREEGEQRVSISQHIIDHVLERQESVLIADALADAEFGLAKSVVLHQIRSAMCTPLRGRTRVVGIIHVDSSSEAGEFSQDDLLLLDAIGNAAGVAVENAQLYQEKIHNERLAAMGQAISGLSHYIKNILAAMDVSASMMEKGLAAGDLEVVRRVWQILRRSIQRISNLVLDMLAYSKDRRPELQPVMVNDICTEVAELCRPMLAAKGATLELALEPDLPPTMADPQGLHRCLLNLMGNAVDALPEQGGIITLATAKADDHNLAITVKDNGAGIPPEIRERIFDVFFSTKGNKGTGLGLAVTRKIIEEHGGSIQVESEEGRGTTFTVILPLHQAAGE